MNGLNQIYLGDCLEVMKRIPDQSIDMILCDLPYGTTQNKWDSIIPFTPLWKQYQRIIKPQCAIVLTASQPFTSALIMSNPSLFKFEWIWSKNKGTGSLNSKIKPLLSHESVIVFGIGKCKYNPIMRQATEQEMKNNRLPVHEKQSNTTVYGKSNGGIFRQDATTRYPKSVIQFNRVGKGAIHPTQKPIDLFEYLIKTHSNPNDIILDNCIGSGTTAIAAMNTGRKWVGIEKDPEIYAKAVQRVANHKL